MENGSLKYGSLEYESLMAGLDEVKNNLLDKYTSNFINLTSNEFFRIINYIFKLQGKETIEKQNIDMVEDITLMRRDLFGEFRPLQFRKELAKELFNKFMDADPDKAREFRALWEESKEKNTRNESNYE